MIEYLKENINWLKDLFTLIFVGTGTVVAILTYRRARATILQPIRTEVIKKQSEILSRLLQILKENNTSFEHGLDYVNLVQLNVLLLLKEYGFIFKDEEKVFGKLPANLAGWLFCGENKIRKDIEIVAPFKEDGEVKNIVDYGQEKYNDLKNGIIDIDKIYTTKLHSEFIKLLTEFSEDPFMPTTIQETLTELLKNISTNLTIILKRELENFLLAFSTTYFETKQAPKSDPVGVYNTFNHSRIHHKGSLNKLKIEIRKYLRIDEGW